MDLHFVAQGASDEMAFYASYGADRLHLVIPLGPTSASVRHNRTIILQAWTLQSVVGSERPRTDHGGHVLCKPHSAVIFCSIEPLVRATCIFISDGARACVLHCPENAHATVRGPGSCLLRGGRTQAAGSYGERRQAPGMTRFTNSTTEVALPLEERLKSRLR